MQERKVVISRVVQSARVLPQTKETPQQRISKFVEAQRQVVAYPFSPELSVKALGKPMAGSKDPSADNKAKRKKAQSKFMRFGVAIFDPDATPQKGQYFEVRPRKINQDGQMGDVPNIGWLDPRKTVKPENLVTEGKKVLASRSGPTIRKVPAKKNPRTGAMEVKALGGTIGRAAGNIGQAAARAAGIVIDGDGKFRCPPGVPAANQFTDEVGSNCFDFSPLVARALVNIAQKFGQNLMQKLGRINSATPFERDDDYKIFLRTRNMDIERLAMLGPSLSLRSSGGRLRGTILGPEDDESRLRGSLLGPDGKPIPPTPEPTATPIEPFDFTERELEDTARDLAEISRGTGEIVDPATYEERFEEAFRAAFPELSNEEIKELAKLAADRERMKDNLRAEQRSAINTIRSFGIDVDENDPVSVQRGIALTLLKMKEMGWDVDLDSYFGEGFSENPERALLEHRRRLAELAQLGVFDAIARGAIHGMSPDELRALQKKYGPNLSNVIMEAIMDGKNPSDVFPDDIKAQQLLAMSQRSLGKARQYETGILLQLVNARQNNPELTDGISRIAHADYDPNDPFFAEVQISKGQLTFFINTHGMLLTHPAESLSNSDSFLYEPTGTAGTEIEKLKRIGEVVTEENRHRLLGSYMQDLGTFADSVSKIRRGEGFMSQSLNDSFGGMALGQFVAFHELTHARQLIMAREIIKSRNPGMSNAEALSLVSQMIFNGGLVDASGVDFDYGSMITDPQVMLTACANMGEIVSILVNNRVGGTYGPSHYFMTFYLNEAMRQSNNVRDLVAMRNNLYYRYEDILRSGRNKDDAELEGLSKAIDRIDRIVGEVIDGEEDETGAFLKVKQSISAMAQTTYLEMQADLSAAVKFGLIEETPEIKTLLAPLSLDGDLPEIRKNIVPPPPPGPPPTKREKAKRLAAVAKRARKMTLADFRETIENAFTLEETLRKIGEEFSEHDRGLMSSGLGSAARFEGRGAASRWGKNVRDAVLLDATEKQRRVVEDANWRNLADVKTPIMRDGNGEITRINEMGMRHRLVMGGVNDSWLATEIEDGFIPFVEVVGDSKLPNSVAAEIVVPGGTIGQPGENMQGRRLEIGTHFTGVLKDKDSLGSAGSPTNPSENQRVIVAVPEGYSGLPDYTPGTDKSEVGSIILPPGEIEIVGMRDDGVAIGRVISQQSADDMIDAKRQELRILDSKLTDMGEKITVRKAVNRIERRQETRRIAGLRSAGETNKPTPDLDTTKIPTEKSSKTRDVLERLNARGIKFGKSRKEDRERKRREKLSRTGAENAGTSSVRRDSHEFESPEEAKLRVTQQVDRAVELIKDGKLPGLAPEVAEIMKEKSPAEIKQMLVESARSFVDGLDKRPRFRIRGTKVRDVKDARDIPLLGFLRTGVYKTTYDADATGVAAASDAAKRGEYEIMLGIPESADDSIRPAHGFFTHKDQAEFEEQWKKAQIDEAESRSPNAVSFRDPSVLPPASGSNNKLKDSDGKMRSVDALPYQYGDSEIVLRTDAAGRSVGTMGDSLNGMRTPFELDGSSTDDEILESFILNRGVAFEQSGGGNAVSPNSQRRIANLLNAHVGKNHSQTTDWTEDGGVPQREYVEAIVAGSFDMSDVEEIKISREFQEAEIISASKVSPNEIDKNHVVELLQDVLPPDDIDSVKKLISESQADPTKKKLVSEIRELVAARLSLVRERKGRRDLRGRVAQHSSGERTPKVTFLNREGINIDDHRTYKRTMDAVGMGEQHEIDDIVKFATAKAIREKMSAAGVSVQPEDSFAALKPQPVVSVADSATGLRSRGAAPMTRTQILEQLTTSPAALGFPEGVGSRSLQMMDEARNRRQEFERILNAARIPDNYFEDYEVPRVLEIADKLRDFDFDGMEQTLETLREITNRPNISDNAKKKIDKQIAKLQKKYDDSRKKLDTMVVERQVGTPGILRGAQQSRRLQRRAVSGERRLADADAMEVGRVLSDIRRAEMSMQGRQNTTEIAQREVLRSSGGRSAFRTRGVGSSLRSSGATRNVDDKLSEGPANLQYGTDSQNLPRVATADELEQRFGDSTRKHKRYFGRYGVKLKGTMPTNPVEKESYYASLQALDDFLQSVDPKKLFKGQKLTVEINPTFMLSPESGVLGEFNRSRRIFFSFGPQKSELRINTSGIRGKASELFQDAQRYRIVDGLEQQVLSDFVSRLFINREALSAPDAENEITRRLTYASMIHELGHFLDYVGTKDEDRVRWRSAMSGMIFGGQDVSSEEFQRGSMLSVSMRDELNQIPSVSRYGVENPQEKVAEGFTAWWLFSKRPDIRIMGDAAKSTDEPRQPVSSTMGETSARIIRGLLEELGPRVKSAKKPTKNANQDDLPPLVTLYTMLPFMIVDGKKA